MPSPLAFAQGFWETEQPGMEQPVTQWTPSVATGAIAFVAQELRRLLIEGNQVVHQEVLIKNAGRVREVATGPDGYLYVAFNQPGRIVRLVPADAPTSR